MVKSINLVNRSQNIKFVDTPTARQIFELLTYCNDNKDIGAIVGKPGVGKTTALRQYVLAGKGVTYCTITPAVNSMTAVMKLLITQLGYYAETRIAANHEIIIDLLERDYVGLVIIDEAQLLNDQIIDELRCLYDHSNFPLVFSGNAELKSRFNNTRIASFAQFTSRIGIRLEIDEPRPGDIKTICDSLGIDGSDTTRKFMTNIAKSSGGLRIIGKIAALAGRGIGNEEIIEHNRLIDAAKLLGAKARKPNLLN